MDTPESKGNQGALAKQKAVPADSTVENSLADFFDKMSKSLERIGNSYPRPPEVGDSKRFEVYSQAYQGFAQNNISKKEGFLLEVKIDQKAYDEFLKKLIEERKNNPAKWGNGPMFG